MNEAQWLKDELSAAAKEAAQLPEWKRWGAEIETQDTATPSRRIPVKLPTEE